MENNIWTPCDTASGERPSEDPETHDFIWNADYTAYRAMRLRWTNDASYARYQAGSFDNDE